MLPSRFVEPLQRRSGVEQRLGRRESLRRDGDERVLGAEFGEHFVERRAIDVRHHRDVIAIAVTTERVDEQVGAERRAADTDMQQMADFAERSEEHTSELQSLMRISYAVFCLKKKK